MRKNTPRTRRRKRLSAIAQRRLPLQGAQDDIDPRVVERLKTIDKKSGLKPDEHAFQLAGLLYVAAHRLRK